MYLQNLIGLKLDRYPTWFGIIVYFSLKSFCQCASSFYTGCQLGLLYVQQWRRSKDGSHGSSSDWNALSTGLLLCLISSLIMVHSLSGNWIIVKNTTWLEWKYCKLFSQGTVLPKASKLVPGSLFPHWNSMRFFMMGSLYDTSLLAEVRFATLYWQSSNMSQIL